MLEVFLDVSHSQNNFETKQWKLLEKLQMVTIQIKYKWAKLLCKAELMISCSDLRKRWQSLMFSPSMHQETLLIISTQTGYSDKHYDPPRR